MNTSECSYQGNDYTKDITNYYGSQQCSNFHIFLGSSMNLFKSITYYVMVFSLLFKMIGNGCQNFIYIKKLNPSSHSNKHSLHPLFLYLLFEIILSLSPPLPPPPNQLVGEASVSWSSYSLSLLSLWAIFEGVM